jgi:hypothetical protein
VVVARIDDERLGRAIAERGELRALVPGFVDLEQ